MSQVKLVCRNDTADKLPPRLGQTFSGLLGRIIKLVDLKFSEVNVIMVSPALIRQLNRSYRHHDRVTDVLSFTYTPRPVSGEIIICLAQAVSQARRHRHSLEQELKLLFVHGSLHLAGHDHMKPGERRLMRALESKALNKSSL
jgi:probable rRNA maturation factor